MEEEFDILCLIRQFDYFLFHSAAPDCSIYGLDVARCAAIY